MSGDLNLIISQKKLALILGGMAIALPTVLYLGNLYIFGVENILGSISSYYHSQMRDVFVGSLFVMGFFLISYEGYDHLERFISSVGGILALAVALFPTPMEGAVRDTAGNIHLLSAGVFYLILTFFCFFRFTKSDPTKSKTFYKKLRNFIYRLSGVLMFVTLILLVVTETGVVTAPIDNSTFWLEYVANSAFGTAWLVKGEGIFFLNDDSVFEWNPWEVFGLIILLILFTGSLLMLGNIFLFL